MSVIEEIKARLRIEELVGETLTLTGRGRVLSTQEHDSLKVWPEQGRWWWFSRGIGGDVVDWWQVTRGCDTRTAVRELAERAGVSLQPLSPEQEQEREAQRRQARVLALAAKWYRAQMWGPSGREALSYCARRGWEMETVRREGLGYSPDNNALSDERLSTTESTEGKQEALRPLANVLREAGLLEEPAARAVLAMPRGMLVYVHRDHGEVVYLSGRSIEGKRHWNLPAELVGGRRVYVNEPDRGEGPALDVTVLVEGQADAVALGQVGAAAAALCGVEAGKAGLAYSHVGLDGDEAGRAKALELALAAGPLTRMVAWGEHKDAAAALQKGWLKREEMGVLLRNAPPALFVLAHQVREAEAGERTALLDRVLDLYADLDEITQTDLKPRLAASLGVPVGQLNRLLAALKKRREAAEKENPERYQYSAWGCAGGLLWEQCVWEKAPGQAAVMYAVRNGEGKVEMRPSVDVGAITYVPYPADMDLIQKRVVMFPERAAEYGDQRALLKEVQGFIHTYLDIDPFYERLAAYYVLFTWLYDLFENLPYLRALGDYGTGKTRFLQTIGALCYRPMFASGAATVSPIFRIIDMFGGTLVVDEADLASSDADNELIKIFNVGYYRGGNVLRSEKDPNSKYDEYWPSAKVVYGPKILATRKQFTDRATESRCLTRRMSTARPRPDIPYTLEASFWQAAQELRNRLLMYRLRSHRQIVLDTALADQTIEPRLNQVTMALKSIVDPEMRQEIDAFVRAYNEQLITDRQMTLPAVVVQVLVETWFDRKPNLLGEDTRDFSVGGLAKKVAALLAEIDPEAKVHPRVISKTCSEDLGLTKRGRHPKTRRDVVIFEEHELRALMLRYGIDEPLPEDS